MSTDDLISLLETRIGQDGHGVCHLSEHEARDIIEALRSIHLFPAITPLEWSRHDSWWAQCPASGKEYMIAKEGALFFAIWDVTLPPFKTLKAAKAAAEAERAARIRQVFAKVPGEPFVPRKSCQTSSRLPVKPLSTSMTRGTDRRR